MEHSFNIDYAKDYGLEEAILIHHLQYWIIKNKANKKHEYYGRNWTYNSYKAFSEIFPYWNEHKMRRILDSLVEQGILLRENYNKKGYDRTSWYAFVDETKFIHNCQKQLADLPNAIDEIAKPIPDTLSSNNTNTYKRTNKKFTPPSKEEVKEYFKLNGYKDEVANRAFNFYDSADWHDTQGRPVKNWKQKMIGVWFKEENKIVKTEARIKL